MESKKFDAFAKSLATWTSRRRFLGGVTGVAAGSLLSSPQAASAQGPEVQDCGPVINNLDTVENTPQNPEGKTNRMRITGAAAAAFDLLDPNDANGVAFAPKEPGRYPENGARFQDFVKQIRCLLQQEKYADQSAEAFQMLLNQSNGLISALTIAYADDQKSLPVESQPKIHALLTQATETPDTCKSIGCIAEALSTEQGCESDCQQSDTCKNTCQSQFFGTLIGKGPNTNDEPKSCLARIYEACGGGCCHGTCVCSSGC
jgi:hypothetical protein